MSDISRTLRREPVRYARRALVIAVVIALTLAVASRAAEGAKAPGRSARGKTETGALKVTLTATPARVRRGAAVHFLASATTQHATGALGYELTYGDGTSAPPVAIPEFCLAGPGRPTSQSWSFTHHYRAVGHYRVKLDVYVNCSSEHATANVMVTVVAM